MISKIKYEYLLFIIAFFWIIIFSSVLQLTPFFSEIGDDGSYLFAAKSLYNDFKIDNTRPLIISLILGFPLLFSKLESHVINWGLFLNFCSWFTSVYLLFSIVSSRFSRKNAFFTSLVFVFCIGNLAIAFNFLSESIFISFVLWAMFFLNKYYLSKELKNLVFSMSLLLLTVLIKPIAIGILLILLLVNIKVLYKILINKYSFLIYVGLVLIFVQIISLKQSYGNYTISYIGSITYYNYLGAKADCLKKDIEYIPGENKRTKEFNLLTSKEQKRVANEDLVYQIKHNTTNLIKAYLFCIYSNSTKASYIVSECKNLNNTNYFTTFYFVFKAVSKIQTIAFTVLGVLISFWHIIKRKQEDSFVFIVAISVLYLFAVSAMSCFQCDRFHIVFFPLVFILFSNLYSKFRLEK